MMYKDFPKLESPFEREKMNGKYVVVDKLKPGFTWIFDPSVVLATEKFDGTNVSVCVKNGRIERVYNRTNRVNVWESPSQFYEGIKRAVDEGKFKPRMMEDGQYFGELLGKKVQGNPYNIDGHLWLPFEYIKEHYPFKFYNTWVEETKAHDLNDLSELFKELKSVYFRRRKQEKHPEGIVFYNELTGEMCKLRGDMFDWFEGKPHKWVERVI